MFNEDIPRGFSGRSFCLLLSAPVATKTRTLLASWGVTDFVEPYDLLSDSVSCDMVLAQPCAEDDEERMKYNNLPNNDAMMMDVDFFKEQHPESAAAIFHGIPIVYSSRYLARCEDGGVYMSPSLGERLDFGLRLSEEERSGMLEKARSKLAAGGGMSKADSSSLDGGGGMLIAEDSSAFVFVDSPNKKVSAAAAAAAPTLNDDDEGYDLPSEQKMLATGAEEKLAFVNTSSSIDRNQYDTTVIPTLKKFVILQCCEFLKNANKFYVMELHRALPPASSDSSNNGQQQQQQHGDDDYVILTTYGRTDDLVNNPGRARHDTRAYPSQELAQRDYDRLLQEKLTVKKYRPVELHTASVGSAQLRKAVAARASEQLNELGGDSSSSSSSNQKVQDPSPEVLELVDTLFTHAQAALAKTILAQVTENGVETPLGALSLTQVQSARAVLDKIAAAIENKFLSNSNSELVALNAHFYSLVPHYLGGRERHHGAAAFMTTYDQVRDKRELLQLAEDLIRTAAQLRRMSYSSGGGGSGDHISQRKMRYFALRASITKVAELTEEHEMVRAKVEAPSKNRVPVRVSRVFKIERAAESEARRKLASASGDNNNNNDDMMSSNSSGDDQQSVRSLFHGSRPERFWGILSRGLLLPGGGGENNKQQQQQQTLSSLGVKRTHSAGWLGSGLYFSHADTTTRYMGKNENPSQDTFFVLIAKVFTGKQQTLRHADFSLTEPEPGYDSVFAPGREQTLRWRSSSNNTSSSGGEQGSDFIDDEFAIYEADHHYQDYLVEVKLPAGALPPAPKEPGGPEGRIATETAGSGSKNLFGQQPFQPFEQQHQPTTSTFSSAPAFGSSAPAFGGGGFGGGFGAQPAAAAAAAAPGFSFGAQISAVSPPKRAAKKKVVADDSEEEEEEESIAFAVKKAAKKTKKLPFKHLPDSSSNSEQDDDGDEVRTRIIHIDAPKKKMAKAPRTKKATGAQFASLGGGGGSGGLQLQTHVDPAATATVATSVEYPEQPFSRPLRTVDDSNFGVPANSDEENVALLRQDRQLRHLFLGDVAEDPFVGLVDVYQGLDTNPTFVRSGLTAAEARVPRVLDYWYDEASPAVVSRDQFVINWADITNGQLDGLDWSGVFAAGGAVASCLTPNAAVGADIDLFLYGIGSDAAAEEKLRHIIDVVTRNREKNGQLDRNAHAALEWDSGRGRFAPQNAADKALPPLVCRTKHAVTIVGCHPLRHIQIVLRMYRSPAEVILGFDIDSCSVGFIGGGNSNNNNNNVRVVATRRARRSFNKRINVVDLDRRSTTYEHRLKKYAMRGFAVAVPGLMLSRISHIIVESAPLVAKSRQQGLAKLLALHCMSNPDLSYPGVRNPACRSDPVGSSRIARRRAKWRTRSAPAGAAAAAAGGGATAPPSTIRTGSAGRPRSADWSMKTSDPAVWPKRAAELSVSANTTTTSASEAAAVATMKQPRKKQQQTPSDYSSVSLPYGPAWTREKVERFLVGKDKSNFFSKRLGENALSAGAVEHEHVVFVGLEAVFTGHVYWCSECCTEKQQKQQQQPSRKITWLRENPGTQMMTSSFQPISDDNYADGAYIDTATTTSIDDRLLTHRHIPSIASAAAAAPDNNSGGSSLPVISIDEVESKEQLAAFAEARISEPCGMVYVQERALDPLPLSVLGLPGPGQLRAAKSKMMKRTQKKKRPARIAMASMPARKSAGGGFGFGGGGGGGAGQQQAGGGGGMFGPGGGGMMLPGRAYLPHCRFFAAPNPQSLAQLLNGMAHNAVGADASLWQTVFGVPAMVAAEHAPREAGLVPFQSTAAAAATPSFSLSSLPKARMSTVRPALLQQQHTLRQQQQQPGGFDFGFGGQQQQLPAFGGGSFDLGGGQQQQQQQEQVFIVFLKEPLTHVSSSGFNGSSSESEQLRDLSWFSQRFTPSATNRQPPHLVFVILQDEHAAGFDAFEHEVLGGGIADAVVYYNGAPHCAVLEPFVRTFVTQRILNNKPQQQQQQQQQPAGLAFGGGAPVFPHPYGAPGAHLQQQFQLQLQLQYQLQLQQQAMMLNNNNNNNNNGGGGAPAAAASRFILCVDAATEDNDEFVRIGAAWQLPVFGLKVDEEQQQQQQQQQNRGGGFGFGIASPPPSIYSLRNIFKLPGVPQISASMLIANHYTIAFPAQLVPLAPTKQAPQQQQQHKKMKTLVVIGHAKNLPLLADYTVHALHTDVGMPLLRRETLLHSTSSGSNNNNNIEVVLLQTQLLSLFSVHDAVVFNAGHLAGDSEEEDETRRILDELERREEQDDGIGGGMQIIKIKVDCTEAARSLLERVQDPLLMESAVDRHTVPSSSFLPSSAAASSFSGLTPREQALYNFAFFFDPRSIPGACRGPASAAGAGGQQQESAECKRFVQAMLLASAGSFAVKRGEAAQHVPFVFGADQSGGGGGFGGFGGGAEGAAGAGAAAGAGGAGFAFGGGGGAPAMGGFGGGGRGGGKPLHRRLAAMQQRPQQQPQPAFGAPAAAAAGGGGGGFNFGGDKQQQQQHDHLVIQVSFGPDAPPARSARVAPSTTVLNAVRLCAPSPNALVPGSTVWLGGRELVQQQSLAGSNVADGDVLVVKPPNAFGGGGWGAAPSFGGGQQQQQQHNKLQVIIHRGGIRRTVDAEPSQTVQELLDTYHKAASAPAGDNNVTVRIGRRVLELSGTLLSQVVLPGSVLDVSSSSSFSASLCAFSFGQQQSNPFGAQPAAAPAFGGGGGGGGGGFGAQQQQQQQICLSGLGFNSNSTPITVDGTSTLRQVLERNFVPVPGGASSVTDHTRAYLGKRNLQLDQQALGQIPPGSTVNVVVPVPSSPPSAAAPAAGGGGGFSFGAGGGNFPSNASNQPAAEAWGFGK